MIALRSAPGGGDRAVDVLGTARRDLGEHLAGRGHHRLERLAGRRGHLDSIDEGVWRWDADGRRGHGNSFSRSGSRE
jgi:hypothetical protein